MHGDTYRGDVVSASHKGLSIVVGWERGCNLQKLYALNKSVQSLMGQGVYPFNSPLGRVISALLCDRLDNWRRNIMHLNPWLFGSLNQRGHDSARSLQNLDLVHGRGNTLKGSTRLLYLHLFGDLLQTLPCCLRLSLAPSGTFVHVKRRRHLWNRYKK